MALIGLFGEFVSDNVCLVTFDPLVMDYAEDLFKPDEKIIRLEEYETNGLSGNTLHLPRLPDVRKSSNDPILKGLSGKTIILMED